MPTPFDTWDAKKVEEVLNDGIPDFVETNRLFIENDHWQDGEGWIGPRPDLDDAEYDAVMALIEQGFVSSNVIAEVVDRHASGVMGHEPVWGFTPVEALADGERPDEALQTLIDEAEALVTEWWNEKGAHDVIRFALANALWGETGLVRAYIPKGRLNLIGGTQGSTTSVTVESGNIQSALRHIYIEAPSPANSLVYTDPETLDEVTILRYTVEVDGVEKDYFELTYVDFGVTEPETVYRLISEGEDQVVRVPLRGMTPVLGVQRPPIVTPQVIQNQKALNLAATLVPKNLADSAFLERTFLNARMPGTMTEVEVNGVKKKVWQPEEYHTGPGAVNFVSGIEVEKPDGTVALTDPQLVHKGPTDINPVMSARGFHYNMILEEVKQSHVLMNEDGRASGKSREMARIDYNISLQSSKSTVEKVGRNFLQGVLALAEQVAGVPGRYTERLRAYFECRIDLGPISVTERQQNNLDVKAGFMSVETLMARAGVLDVDKEKALIASSEEYRVNRLKQFAEIVSSLNGAGVKPSTVATIMGMEADIISALTTAEAAVESNNADNTQPDPAGGSGGNPQGGV